ncbi:hypothetical protein [Streptomyces niveus]|uniref:hypothetical protein n=1 Tax=Streptomyces niveus TaxID=193462 RepID=UPI0038671BD8
MNRRPRRRPALNSPLARWGFTVLAGLAVATGQPIPAFVCATLAALAWKARP